MNKALAFLLFLITVAISGANAQSVFMASSQLPESAKQNVMPAIGKQQISSDELPKSVKKVLKRGIFKDWKISEAYVVAATVTEADSKPVYEVYLTNANQTRAVARFYENGKAISGKK